MKASIEEVFGSAPHEQHPRKSDWDWLKQKVDNVGLKEDWLREQMKALYMPEPEFDFDGVWVNAVPPLTTALWVRIGEAERAKIDALRLRDQAYAADELYSVEALTNPVYRAEVLKCLAT